MIMRVIIRVKLSLNHIFKKSWYRLLSRENVMYIIIIVTLMRSKGAERRQGLYRASFNCGRTGQHYHFSFQPKSNYAQRKGIDILIIGTQLTMRFTDLPKEVSPSKFYFYSFFTSSLFQQICDRLGHRSICA